MLLKWELALVVNPTLALAIQGPGVIRRSASTPLEVTVPLDVAHNLADLVTAAAGLSGMILNEFGLPAPWMLTLDGTVRVYPGQPLPELPARTRISGHSTAQRTSDATWARIWPR